MGLKEDAAKIFRELFGDVVAKQVENFDDPEKYPEDFLEECESFLAQLIGAEMAKKKMQLLSKRYLK